MNWRTKVWAVVLRHQYLYLRRDGQREPRKMAVRRGIDRRRFDFGGRRIDNTLAGSFEKLGLENIELKLSHAGLIRALLTGFGLSPEEQGKVFDRILDGDVAVLTRLKEETPELARLLTPVLDMKGETPGFLRNLKTMFSSSLPEFIPAWIILSVWLIC